jgi:hypothetical protein
MIDVNQQLIDLFNKEKMLAFFDFRLNLGGDESVSGLCKISRPKGTGEQIQYISLLFLIDTPNEAVGQQVDTFTRNIGWSSFREAMPGVQTVLPIPAGQQGAGIYFKETDIYLNSDVVISKAYVASKLYPAISNIVGLRAGELVFWDDLPEKKQAFQGIVPGEKPGQSIVSRLKDFFGL